MPSKKLTIYLTVGKSFRYYNLHQELHMSIVHLGSDPTCGICLDSILQNEMVSIHTPHKDGAKHPYHKTCIEKWTAARNSCPACSQRTTWQSIRAELDEKTNKLVLKIVEPKVGVAESIFDRLPTVPAVRNSIMDSRDRIHEIIRISSNIINQQIVSINQQSVPLIVNILANR